MLPSRGKGFKKLSGEGYNKVDVYVLYIHYCFILYSLFLHTYNKTRCRAHRDIMVSQNSACIIAANWVQKN